VVSHEALDLAYGDWLVQLDAATLDLAEGRADAATGQGEGVAPPMDLQRLSVAALGDEGDVGGHVYLGRDTAARRPANLRCFEGLPTGDAAAKKKTSEVSKTLEVSNRPPLWERRCHLLLKRRGQKRSPRCGDGGSARASASITPSRASASP